MENNNGLGFFEKYLTLWVTVCIILGLHPSDFCLR